MYLTGDFTKEDLSERKSQLDSTVNELRKEKVQLADHLEKLTYSDADIETIEDFCSKINHNLDNITYEGKRRIIDMLDVRGTLAIENEEKVIYVSCLITPQPVSLALTSPSSNTGEIAIRSCASLPTVRFP